MIYENEESLEETLAQPSPEAAEQLAGRSGGIVVLGAAGKMGPSLCRLLQAAAPGRTVTAVSRFSDARTRQALEKAGVRTVAADLLDPAAYGMLPEAEDVYFLVGMKFGAGSQAALTWAMNTYLPARVAEHYAGSRIVALSTGNVYPFVPAAGPTASETTPPDPVGEYAQSCLGRERIFEYFSRRHSTPITLIRLNYANEPRYGIIVDLTRQILAGEPIDLTTGHVNLIWQRDACDYIARAVILAESPPAVLNVTGPETVSVRRLAEEIGRLLGREPRFTGQEAPTALLADAALCFARFGYPRMPLRPMVEAIVAWVAGGGRTLGKPTKFQVRTGRF